MRIFYFYANVLSLLKHHSIIIFAILSLIYKTRNCRFIAVCQVTWKLFLIKFHVLISRNNICNWFLIINWRLKILFPDLPLCMLLCERKTWFFNFFICLIFLILSSVKTNSLGDRLVRTRENSNCTGEVFSIDYDDNQSVCH